jgi:hypothetical protein
MENEKREIHVMLSATDHQAFMCKVRSEDSNASQKVRGWIRKFLRGELS